MAKYLFEKILLGKKNGSGNCVDRVEGFQDDPLNLKCKLFNKFRYAENIS